MAESLIPLLCPYCAGALEIEYVYDGSAYSEHRSVETIDCEDCWASWKPDGHPLQGPRI